MIMLHYKLIDEEYTGKPEKIAEIMERINRKLYEDYKLKLYLVPLGAEYEKACIRYLKENNMELLLEETLWKNLTEDQKINKFLEYIKEIDGINKEILIIDQYFFCKKPDSDYENFIVKIFERGKFSKICIVTNKNYNDTLYRSIKNKVKCSIDLKFTDEIHDRFWIANQSKGFYVGTSLNGVGKKYSRIGYMENEEVKDYINIVNKIK